MTDILYSPLAWSTFTNGVWAGGGVASSFAVSYVLRRYEPVLGGMPGLLEAMHWARVPGLCLAAHRLYWNVAVWTRDRSCSECGDYNQSMADAKHWLAVVVLLAVYAGWRSVRPFIPPDERPLAASLALAVCLGFGLISQLLT